MFLDWIHIMLTFIVPVIFVCKWILFNEFTCFIINYNIILSFSVSLSVCFYIIQGIEMRNHLQNNKKKRKRTRRCLFKSSTVFHLFFYFTMLCYKTIVYWTMSILSSGSYLFCFFYSVHKSRTAIEDKMKKFQHRNASQRIWI